MTNAIFGLCASLLVTAIWLIYFISYSLKLKRERPLIEKSKHIYRQKHISNFFYTLAYGILPLLFIAVLSAHIIFFIGFKSSMIFWITTALYLVYILLCMAFLLIYYLCSNIMCVFLYEQSLVFMNVIININSIALIDYNPSKKHVYINYINDGNEKSYLKLHNKKTLTDWLKLVLDSSLFQEDKKA